MRHGEGVGVLVDVRDGHAWFLRWVSASARISPMRSMRLRHTASNWSSSRWHVRTVSTLPRTSCSRPLPLLGHQLRHLPARRRASARRRSSSGSDGRAPRPSARPASCARTMSRRVASARAWNDAVDERSGRLPEHDLQPYGCRLSQRCSLHKPERFPASWLTSASLLPTDRAPPERPDEPEGGVGSRDEGMGWSSAHTFR